MSTIKAQVRTRFAPSPTGYLHIGGLRTALYAYFFARKNGGRMLLRIEDTDKEREVAGALGALINTLRAMGIDYDEGPDVGGDYGPYVQSQRLEIYKEHAQKLLDDGHAYRCFCSHERLEKMREEQKLSKQQPKYDRNCLKLSEDEVKAKLASGGKHVVRMKIPEGETIVDDVVYGKCVFPNSDLDDQVLLKSDGYPTYHLAVVVDDHLMKISHVLRGEDWLSSAPKHVILYNMFGWDKPVFAHLPNLQNADKKKLSKRQGDVAVEDFLDKGYLPSAINNFVATLGFNPKGDQEIYSMQEFIDLFDLEKVHRSGAVVNYEKLDWVNAQHIKNLDIKELASITLEFLRKRGVEVGETERFERIIFVERERMVTLADMIERIEIYNREVDYAQEILVWKKSDREDALNQLTNVHEVLSTLDESNFSNLKTLEEHIKNYVSSNNLQNGNVLWPMRVALSGREQSPSPFELAWVFGKMETLKRLKKAQEKLS
jgi:glutamyl-tRNA synthetase